MLRMSTFGGNVVAINIIIIISKLVHELALIIYYFITLYESKLNVTSPYGRNRLIQTIFVNNSRDFESGN